MKTVELKSMNEAEFSSWREVSKVNYAKDREKEGYTPEDARALSEKSFQSLLPEGILTKDQYLYVVCDSENSSQVGILWWGLQKQGTKFLPWIYDIAIDEHQRGKGYGKATMLAAEADVKAKGHDKLGLHVFGHNSVARSLYEALNFRITNVVMQKDLN